MGRFSKKTQDGDTSGGFITRSIKKLSAWVLASLIYGVFYTDIVTTLLDKAIFSDQIPIWDAISISLVKSLQFGVLKAPELLTTGISKIFVEQLPLTGIIRYIIPFIILYSALYQLVSIVLDLIDMREEDKFHWITKSVITGLFMFGTWAVLSGWMFFTDSQVTFNATEIVQNYQAEHGGVNQSVKDAVNGSLGVSD